MLLLRADDEVLTWMRLQVAEPRDYMVRLARDRCPRTMLEATDRFVLRLAGRSAHDRAAMQRAVPIGRAFSFREQPEVPPREQVLLAAAAAGLRKLRSTRKGP